jgi:hypothetical protein
MKSVSEVVHKTPWWALLASGLALAIGLAVFVTPYHLINLEKKGATPEERQAIKREVDLTFSEGAIDIARGVVREMRRHAKDPARQEELDQALEQIDEARSTLREAGAEVLRAKREAGEEVVRAAGEAERAISQAKRDAAKALERAGVDPTEVNKKLEEAAKAAAEDTKKAGEDAAASATPGKRRIIIGGGGPGDKPIVARSARRSPGTCGASAWAPGSSSSSSRSSSSSSSPSSSSTARAPRSAWRSSSARRPSTTA